MPKQKLISREEVLDGLGGRAVKQANMVLTLIENRTAHLVAQAQRVANTALAVAATQTPRHAFLTAIAEGRTTLPPPTIQELERFAPHWAILAPENPEIRATVIHLLGQKYALPANAIPGIEGAFGLDNPVVQQAYQRLYNQPISTIFAPQVTPRQQLRWLWSAFSARVETLPPFWLTFFLTMPAASGLLALPIALANVGPRWGVTLILLFGLINLLTVAALAETVVRSADGAFWPGLFGAVGARVFGRCLHHPVDLGVDHQQLPGADYFLSWCRWHIGRSDWLARPALDGFTLCGHTLLPLAAVAQCHRDHRSADCLGQFVDRTGDYGVGLALFPMAQSDGQPGRASLYPSDRWFDGGYSLHDLFVPLPGGDLWAGDSAAATWGVGPGCGAVWRPSSR